jgi:D-alanyl-D-alanine carboxypeptidase
VPLSVRRPYSQTVGFALAAAVLIAALAAPTAMAGPYILIDAKNGNVIAQSDAGRPWYPASITKIMTAYLAFRAVREGRIELDSLVKVSANALAQPPSKMGFPAGTELTLDNAIKILMVRSANDIAVVVAEGVSGSVEKFVEEMNWTAALLGMSATRFANPHGLPDESQVTTARDIAVLAQAIVRDFPEYELYFRIPAIRIGKRLLRNHNTLIDRYPGADGMKTGFICSSGFNLVASAARGDTRLIAVLFGSFSAAQRAEDAARLFEIGFRQRVSLAALFGYDAPNLKSVENLAMDPADLRSQMCDRKGGRPPARSIIDEGADGIVSPPQKGETLLVDLPPSMAPVRVFLGAPRSAATPATEPEASAKTAATPSRRPGQVPMPRPRPSI